ncbi:hypothetical protein NB545_09630 [Vibrio campbellii]|jgi:hypothetical protein|uniref:hypothetical protein n=1 Tax=Vibrio campbellii TaxID=680 RepID=UPI00215C5EC0|nr:hypothetical protein [Vibrio campbellii]MCR9907721.1 hypothetical protein [Vibrio campbellii]
MHLPPQESIEQLQFELNDTKGRLDALSFMARIILDSVKLQDEEAYQALKTACLTYSHDHLATLGEIGEDDIEEQAQSFAEEIENLFCDEEDLFGEE